VPWVYIDDHWDEHPKFLEAYEIDPQSIVLFFAGLAFCRRSKMPGLVQAPQVKRLLGYRPKAVKALVTAELWEEVALPNGAKSGAIDIHDYEQWNRTEHRSAAAKVAAKARWDRAKRDAS
jgi:hypothetical protein